MAADQLACFRQCGYADWEINRKLQPSSDAEIISGDSTGDSCRPCDQEFGTPDKA